jgi:hypothetical protein
MRENHENKILSVLILCAVASPFAILSHAETPDGTMVAVPGSMQEGEGQINSPDGLSK